MEAKEKSQVQQKVDELLHLASVLEKLDGIFDATAYLCASGTTVETFPNNEDDARRKVGALIRLLKAQPKIEKPYASALHLNATFEYNGISIVVHKYKGKKCAVKKTRIIHEAKPEQIIPAKEAWVEEVEELVCEMPAVDAEVAAFVPKEEVPF